MAVLKSPTNNRNKRKWFNSFALLTSKSTSYRSLQSRKSIRITHKFESFLSNSAYGRHVNKANKNWRFYLPEEDFTSIRRPRKTLKYGPRLFDTHRAYPTLFKSRFNVKGIRENYFYISNLSNF